MDRITLQRIELLHPKLRGEVDNIYRNQIVPALSGRAICRFAYTLRTFDEQNKLFAIGRTKLFDSDGKRLGIVTNAQAGESIHNYGLALDIVLLEDKDKNGSFETARFDTVVDYDGDRKSDWMEVVDIFKKNGWVWGGDWKKFSDAPHFEKTFGHTFRQLRKLYDRKKFITGTNYVNI